MSLDSELSETDWPDSQQGSITEMWPRRQIADSGPMGYRAPDGVDYTGPGRDGGAFGQRWNFGPQGPAQSGLPPASGTTPPIDPTTGQPVSPPSTTPTSSLDLGSIFGSLQTTTVLGIPLLYILIGVGVYFFVIKKGR